MNYTAHNKATVVLAIHIHKLITLKFEKIAKKVILSSLKPHRFKLRQVATQLGQLKATYMMSVQCVQYEPVIIQALSKIKEFKCAVKCFKSFVVNTL